MHKQNANSDGLTIVELLIVIVVISILAAISVVVYTGIQQRARDSQRSHDIRSIAKALEMYYVDHGEYPSSGCSLGSGCKINGSWVSTSDGSWANLEAQLVPEYVAELPQDPSASTATSPAIYGGYNYDYVVLWNESCTNGRPREKYMLAYRLEASSSKIETVGDCTNPPSSYSGSSQYRVIK